MLAAAIGMDASHTDHYIKSGEYVFKINDQNILVVVDVESTVGQANFRLDMASFNHLEVYINVTGPNDCDPLTGTMLQVKVFKATGQSL